MEIAFLGEGLGISLSFPITNANYSLHLHSISRQELVRAQAVECLLFGGMGVLVLLKVNRVLRRLNICRHAGEYCSRGWPLSVSLVDWQLLDLCSKQTVYRTG